MEDDSLGVGKRQDRRGRPEIAPGMRQKHQILFRLDFHRMTRLRALAKAEGTSPSLLCKRWVMERLGRQGEGDHITEV